MALNRLKLREYSELQLFGIIYSLGGFIFYSRHDHADGRIEWTPELEAAVEEARADSRAAIGELTRFGVERPLDEEGGPTREYWAWYLKMKPMWVGLEEQDQNALLREVSSD